MKNVLKHHQRAVYVYQFFTSNSNFNTTSNLPNFLFPSILLILYRWIPKNHKQPNTLICGISREISDCLKHEWDICVKTIIPSQNTALAQSLVQLKIILNYSVNYSQIFIPNLRNHTKIVKKSLQSVMLILYLTLCHMQQNVSNVKYVYFLQLTCTTKLAWIITLFTVLCTKSCLIWNQPSLI